jgi:hypothetical protein
MGWAQAYTRAKIWDERLFKSLSAAARRLEKGSVSAAASARLVAAFSKVETRQGSRLRDGALFMKMGSIVKGLDAAQLALDPRLVSNIVNAFAKARVWDEELFRLLSRAARLTSAAQMQPSECGALVGSFAKAQRRQGARIKDGALFRRMSLIIQGCRADQFTPRSIANIASGYAHAGILDARLLQRIARLALGLDHDSPGAPAAAAGGGTAAAAVIAQRSLAEFKPQELTSLSWSLAKYASSQQQQQQQRGAQTGDIEDGGDIQLYFRHLAAHLQLTTLSGFKAQEMSTLLWSFCAVSSAAPAVFEMGERELKRRAALGPVPAGGRRASERRQVLPSFNPHDITILAWAFAGSYRSPTVMALLARRILPLSPTAAPASGSARPAAQAGDASDISQWTGRQIATFAISMAKAGVRDQEMWTAIRTEVMNRTLEIGQGLWCGSPSAALLGRPAGSADRISPDVFADVPSDGAPEGVFIAADDDDVADDDDADFEPAGPEILIAADSSGTPPAPSPPSLAVSEFERDSEEGGEVLETPTAARLASTGSAASSWRAQRTRSTGSLGGRLASPGYGLRTGLEIVVESSQRRQGKAYTSIAIQDLINVLWAATLARRMEVASPCVARSPPCLVAPRFTCAARDPSFHTIWQCVM